MTIHGTRGYKKLDSYSKKTIDISIKKLQKRFDEYLKQGIVITNLFGDNVLVHEIINKNFYVYKCHERNVQVRLLYEINNNRINVIDYFIKNNDNALKSTIGRYQQKYLTRFKEIAADYQERVYEV